MSELNVVVFGGGHGAAAMLRAARAYATSVTGVITVADDGGSSGRLRTAFEMVAVGAIARQLELRMPCFLMRSLSGAQSIVSE